MIYLFFPPTTFVCGYLSSASMCTLLLDGLFNFLNFAQRLAIINNIAHCWSNVSSLEGWWTRRICLCDTDWRKCQQSRECLQCGLAWWGMLLLFSFILSWVFQECCCGFRLLNCQSLSMATRCRFRNTRAFGSLRGSWAGLKLVFHFEEVIFLICRHCGIFCNQAWHIPE